MKQYKFILINEKVNTFHIVKSLRDIEHYINEQYPENKTSHMSISRRLKESEYKHYKYYDIIVKKFIWDLNDLKK